MLLVAIAAVWAALAAFFWAIIHVGARDDPPEWDEPQRSEELENEWWHATR
jgi:hypothetical protein